MKCAECESEAAEVSSFTEDARTEIRCTACGFHWIHGPSPAEKRAGQSGGTKHHCPVCVAIFSDPTAPIVTIGTPSKSGHRCDRTKSFQLGARYGASEKALDKRLAELDDQALAGWPRVLEMKRERLSR